MLLRYRFTAYLLYDINILKGKKEWNHAKEPKKSKKRTAFC